GSFLQRSPRRCSCGLRARAVLLSPSTALQKTSSTCSGPCGLHESPAHRSRCHKAARDIVPLTASFPDRCEATFRIPSRAPESGRICRALRLGTEERTAFPRRLPRPKWMRSHWRRRSVRRDRQRMERCRPSELLMFSPWNELERNLSDPTPPTY